MPSATLTLHIKGLDPVPRLRLINHLNRTRTSGALAADGLMLQRTDKQAMGLCLLGRHS
ncbi:MAG: hypothetical protein LZF62_310139 [Nitrospira sp.]|nr:MAG: hypothetical protein LZF62_310139 [Nitrospira sp.]